MMLDWRLIGVASSVIIAGLGCMTLLALHGIVPGTTAAVAIAGVLTTFGAWLAPPPKDTTQEKDGKS